MIVVSKWGANYLVIKPKEYNPKKEVLFFGITKIIPGQKIKRIGLRDRTSFEVDDFMIYEGTMIEDDLKYCLFKSTWSDGNDILYRYAFCMDNTNKPLVLYLSGKTGYSGRDINCRIVELINKK